MRFALAALCLITVPAFAHDAVPLRPDPKKTPGPAEPTLYQAQVCSSSFDTKDYRRGSKSERRCILARYRKPSYAFTYDHLVPLELGGLDGCDNLWPQPRAEAKRKDQLKNALQAHVCICHDLTLKEAQDVIRANWLQARARYVTPKGSAMCAVNP